MRRLTFVNTKFLLKYWRMALMHDYVRRANFTTKPRLRGIFSAFALFVRGYSFKFTALGHSFMQNFATLQFKTRLGGEICSFDVNMHKGYCSHYFTALQYINNLETKRWYKRKVNLKNLKFFKKSIERFKNYSLIR